MKNNIARIAYWLLPSVATLVVACNEIATTQTPKVYYAPSVWSDGKTTQVQILVEEGRKYTTYVIKEVKTTEEGLAECQNMKREVEKLEAERVQAEAIAAQKKEAIANFLANVCKVKPVAKPARMYPATMPADSEIKVDDGKSVSKVNPFEFK